jgi:Zn-dependent protease/CBS domain-containing protein
MKWSWKIFTAFGIDVYVHATFLFLLLIFLFTPVIAGKGNLGQGFASMALIVIVFGCVLLHEFGHALVAKQFGVRTRDITLLPIGGLARLERIPSEPRQELAIAVAGPAVNFGIASALLLLGLALGWGPEILPEKVTVWGRSFLQELIAINLVLAIFNFIPAFPMDGGRVLRALLALKLDYVQATRIAVGVGQALAFAFGLYGLLNDQILLVLVAFFVYMGAGQEGAATQYRQSFRGLPTSCAMMRSFQTLEETDRLEKAVDLLLRGSQIDFPVLREGRVIGLLTRGILIDSLGKKGPLATVGSVDLQKVEVIEDDLPLDLAYDALQAQSIRCIPVTRRGDLVGLVTMENLAEFAMVQSALKLKEASAGRVTAV